MQHPFITSKIALLFILAFSSNLFAAASDHFVTTWETTAVDTVITIPTFPGETYSYAIDWDNDMIPDQTGITGDATHDYGSAGIHTIRIFGTFPRIYINNDVEKNKILSIDQWGTNVWTSMGNAFLGAANLVNNALDTPDLSSCTVLQNMFANASSIGSPVELGNWSWNTATILDMKSMFLNASSFDKDIGNWVTNNVSNMQSMFANAVVFNQDLSAWNVENVSTDFFFFLNNTAFSTINYDKLLIAWSNQNILSNSLFQLGAQYCSVDAQNARANIISNFNWTITDGGLCPEALFRTTWKTDNLGTSNDTSITIPTEPMTTYAYQVDWNGDGDFNDVDEGTIQTGDATHDYGVIQTNQTINIKGLFPQIYFNNSGDKDKITSIDQWGTNTWLSMTSAFFGASNLVNNTLDAPDLSNCSSLSLMFANAASIGSMTANWSWDTSNITALNSMFINASSFDEDISSWNVENVIGFNFMFTGVILSSANYGALLISWDAQTLSPNETFNGGNSQYCSQAAVDARANLTVNDGWTITDGGHTNACDVLFENSFEEVIIVKSAKKQMNYDFSEVSLDTLNQEQQLIVKGLDNNDKENMHIHIRNDLGVLQVRVSYLRGEQWIAQQWFDVDNNKTITLQW